MSDTAPRSLPSDDELGYALRSILGRPLRIASRRANAYASSFPSEVVVARRLDRAPSARDEAPEQLGLFIKYETGGARDTGFSTRRGLGYEASVYRELLEGSGAACCYGYWDPPEGTAFLALAHLEDAYPFHEARQEDALERVALWLGGFHRRMSSHARAPFLQRIDADVRCSWSRNVVERAREADDAGPWLVDLADAHEQLVANSDRSSGHTVIHGEPYPMNILMHSSGSVHPIDWESAAYAAGELDLAILLDAWGRHRRAAFECYVDARWPQGAPDDFEARLTLAELSLAFRMVEETTTLAPGRLASMLERLKARLPEFEALIRR